MEPSGAHNAVQDMYVRTYEYMHDRDCILNEDEQIVGTRFVK
jgi:hypothetical protein